MEIRKISHRRSPFSDSRGVLPEKLGGAVRSTSQKPYPIYDQNLWFSLSYLWPGKKIGLPIYDRYGWHSFPKHSLWWAVIDCLIDKVEKVASSKKHAQFKTRVQKPYPIYNQNGQNRCPIYDQNGWKTIPFGAAYTYIAHILEYSPPPFPPRF